MLPCIETARIYARRVRMLRRLWSLTDPSGFAELVLPGAEKTVPVGALAGGSVTIRGGTSDIDTFGDVFGSFPHLPPVALTPHLIWDLGANIGLTMAHFAHTYPDARIVGVELDRGNAELARRNVSRYGGRCDVICAAVWTAAGSVGVRRVRGHESGFRVAEGGVEAETLLLNDLLAQTGPPDFAKMDLEGAEQRVLAERTEWTASVPAIMVECHGSYIVADCLRDLAALGYTTQEMEHAHGRPAVFGHRH